MKSRGWAMLLSALLGWPGVTRGTDFNLSNAFIRRLVRARDVRAADRLRARFESARAAALSCDWQRARALAPIACYEVLRLEIDWATRDRPDAARVRADLDRRCRTAADRFKVPGGDGALRFVGRDCAARVREARSFRAYRDEDPGWSDD